MVSHCGFDLYFPDDERCGAFFHVSVGHLDVFFEEVSIHVFCPFLHWIICFQVFPGRVGVKSLPSQDFN